MAAEEAALAEAKSKEERRLAGLEKYRKRSLQQKNYRETISAKAKVQVQKQKVREENPGEDDAAIENLAAIRVQSAIRKRQSHVRVKSIRDERSRAAQGLQRVARGRRDRRRVSLLQDKQEAERVQRVQMAKELQRVARGRASRKRVQRLRKLSAVEKEAAEEAVRREMKRQEDEEKERQLQNAQALAKEEAEALAKEEAEALAKEEAGALAREEAEAENLAEEGAKGIAEEEAEALAEEGVKALAEDGAEAKAEEGAKALAEEGADALAEVEDEDEDDDYGNDFSFESASTPMKVLKPSVADAISDQEQAMPIELPPNYTKSSPASSGNTDINTTMPSPRPKFSIGERIEAQVEGWAKAYAGEIIEEPMVRSDGSVSYSIKFDDGEVRASVDASLVQPIAAVSKEALQTASSSIADGASAATAAVAEVTPAAANFKIGDRVQAQCSGWSVAYPGEIIDEPMVRMDGTVSYSIKFDDGEIRSSVEGVLVSSVTVKSQVVISPSSEATAPVITSTETEEEGQEMIAHSIVAEESSGSAVRRFDRGDRVEAQCSGWAKAYAGEIIDAPLVRSDGTVAYTIRFDDGEERQNVDGVLVSGCFSS